MRLLVVRHAKAQELSSTGDDFDRNLTGAGIERAEKLGSIILKKNYLPDEVFSSPLNRTLQTVQVLQRVAFPQLKPIILEELAPDITLFDSLRSFFEEKARSSLTAMIVGHQPELGFLVSTLLAEDQPRIESLSPGTMVVLELAEWGKRVAKLVEVV